MKIDENKKRPAADSRMKSGTGVDPAAEKSAGPDADMKKAARQTAREKKTFEMIKNAFRNSSAAMSPAGRKAAALSEETGHPLNILALENRAVEKGIEELRNMLDEGRPADDIRAELMKFRELGRHYAKKGDLLYPILKQKYGVSGPSDTMWTVDDEIRDELKKIAEEDAAGDRTGWEIRLKSVLQRAEEMIFKEDNVIFPACANKFSNEDWVGIRRDMDQYDLCLIKDAPAWAGSGEYEADMMTPMGEAGAEGEDEIFLPSGHFSREELTAMLDTLPFEITFIDADDINLYFNDNGPKFFKRPLSALDREVYYCHPPKIEPMVRSIVADFKSGRRDSVEIWMEKEGRPVLVRYMAVRDKSGKFMGTMELVQEMTFARDHFAGTARG